VDTIRDLDLVIVARGGGSREDLWAFNTESVARAVAALPVPCISAIGHETDVTLTDLVADLRVPTPSAAAEAAVPDRGIVAGRVEDLGRRLAGGLNRWLTWGNERLDRTADMLQSTILSYVAARARTVGELGATLDALSPLRVLQRGYAVPRDSDGRVLRNVADFVPGSLFDLTVSDGKVTGRVEKHG
jgi:exodeoxyribonuclease VII large subunit